MKTQSAKAALGLKKTLETFFDEEGRECTTCGVYQIWDNFPVHKRSKTGRASQCRECKALKKKSSKRNYKKEKHQAKEHKKNLKKTDPYLVRARNIRTSLMNRRKKHDLPAEEIPTAEEIKKWLMDQLPLTCFYSSEPVGLWDMHIDHKVSLNRGGSNSLSNLCVSSALMNSSKGAMTDEEFSSLLVFLESFEDKGDYLLSRLRNGYFRK